MFRIKRKLLTCLTLLGIASWTQLAFADAQSTSPSVNGAVEASSAIAVSTADLPLSAASAPVARKLFAGKPVTAEVLAAKRGGDRVFNENQLKGVVADNHASNLTTGMNVITDGAFFWGERSAGGHSELRQQRAHSERDHRQRATEMSPR